MRALKPLSVLVIASQEMKKLYGATLRSVGAECTWNSSLKEVLRNRENLSPAVVILDLDSESEPVQVYSGQLRAVFPSADWLALSSQDSAQTAMTCLRAGFTDFLVKPVNPGELAWAILRCQQRRQARKQWSESPTRLLEAVTEMTACSSVTLLRITALQYLREVFSGKSAAWISKQSASKSKPIWKVEQAVPHSTTNRKKIALPKSAKYPAMQWKYSSGKNAGLWIPSRIFQSEGIFVSLKSKPNADTLKDARSLVEHLELSHANLSRLEQMRQQTFLDDLTGLYNARYLRHCLEKEVQDYRETKKPFCVLFIDLDRFKMVNDQHGHLIGSSFLKALGRSLKNLVRSQDLVFRYGGDEFVVVLRDAELSLGLQIGERIRKSVEKRVFLLEAHSLKATLSIGVAAFPAHAKDLDTLLQLADQAMYDAKKKSRNAVQSLPLSRSRPSPTL